MTTPERGIVLRRNQRQLVRDVTREAWLETGGNVDETKRIVCEKFRNGYGSIIGTILVGLAIRLSFKLIMYWWNNRVSEPEHVFVAGEPGADSDDA